MIVWTYVITYDRGGAPNFEPPATTLTLCAPRVRSQAVPGNLVLAFNGNVVRGISGRESHPERHSVRWAGIVAEEIPLADYWNDPRFEGKKPGRSRGYPDNIYRPVNSGFDQVPNPTHDKSFAENDTRGAKSLVFHTVWYFGRNAPTLGAHFGVRMNGGRRTPLCWEINEATWHKLRRWLDDAKSSAGLIDVPIVVPAQDGPCTCQPTGRSNAAPPQSCR